MDAYAEFIEQLSASAKQELAIEETLKVINKTWEELDLDIVAYKYVLPCLLFCGWRLANGCLTCRQSLRVRSTEDVNKALEDNVVTLGAMKTSRYYHAFATQVDRWERTLALISETLDMLLQVQRSWMYLESIFGSSEDLRRMMPDESTYVPSRIYCLYVIVLTGFCCVAVSSM